VLSFDCDAVLFDMDGTIVDSRALVEMMWLRWARRRGVAAEAVLAVAHGRPTLDTMRLVAPQFATPEEAAALDAEEAGEEGGEVQVPGAGALLGALPANRWAVFTSAFQAIARARIARVGLPVPAVLLGADDVARGKPDPEGYLEAARRLGVAPDRCLVFEDTQPGVSAARAMGAPVVGLLTTHTWLEGCEVLIPDLRGVRLVEPARGWVLRVEVQPRDPGPDTASSGEHAHGL
jgi:sugar-phosphatase